MSNNSDNNLQMQEELYKIDLVNKKEDIETNILKDEVLMSFEFPIREKKKFIRKINKYESLLKELIEQINESNNGKFI